MSRKRESPLTALLTEMLASATSGSPPQRTKSDASADVPAAFTDLFRAAGVSLPAASSAAHRQRLRPRSFSIPQLRVDDILPSLRVQSPDASSTARKLADLRLVSRRHATAAACTVTALATLCVAAATARRWRKGKDEEPPRPPPRQAAPAPPPRPAPPVSTASRPASQPHRRAPVPPTAPNSNPRSHSRPTFTSGGGIWASDPEPPPPPPPPTRKRAFADHPQKRYYELLGATPATDAVALRRLYRAACMKHHPDKHGSCSEEERAAHEGAFKALGEAFGVLSSPTGRRKYDAESRRSMSLFRQS